MLSPVKHPATGATLFEGHLWPGAELEWDTIGGPEPLRNAVTALENIAFDRSWKPEQFDVAADMERVVRSDNGLLASDSFNLKPFFDGGGKLLMWHGWADPQVTPQNSTIYFENVLATVGREAEASIALFMLPGVYHCQGGPGTDRFDRMAAISGGSRTAGSRHGSPPPASATAKWIARARCARTGRLHDGMAPAARMTKGTSPVLLRM